MRADRLLSILLLLQTKGQMTAQELADQLEVSPRTIYRDLDALSGAGVPVYAERGPNGGCMLLESYRTNLTGLRENEVRALFMFTVPGLVADLGVEKDAAAALLKLSAALPAPFQKDAQRVQERLYLDAAPWFRPEEPVPFLQVLQQALWHEQRVRMVYRRSDGQWIKRLVDPYGLVAKASTWYMVGAIYGGKPQVYRVSRIQEARVSNGRFTRPADFNLTHFWQTFCTEVESRRDTVPVTLRVGAAGFTPLTRLLGEGLHQLLAQASQPDDHGQLRLQLSFASLEEACEQLLGLGTAVEVLEPPTLRRQIAQAAQKIAALYQEEGL